MKRLHLVELGDLPWWPRLFRDYATDYLAAVVRIVNPYTPALPKLTAALHRCNTTDILDLCSGGGGPWPVLLPAVRAELPDLAVRLSDKFPNAVAFARQTADTPGLSFEPEPVDATAVPAHLTGFRTLFAGFHHFRPTAAKAILAAAVRDRRGIAIGEATARTSKALLLMLFVVPLAVLLVTPRIRPFRWSRLVWTYLLPVLPLAVAFDGFVSCLRTYTPDELRAMVADMNGYEWEAGTATAPGAAIPTTYLIGVPR